MDITIIVSLAAIAMSLAAVLATDRATPVEEAFGDVPLVPDELRLRSHKGGRGSGLNNSRGAGKHTHSSSRIALGTEAK
jgi:hypothetical protein